LSRILCTLPSGAFAWSRLVLAQRQAAVGACAAGPAEALIEANSTVRKRTIADVRKQTAAACAIEEVATPFAE
jgi:hypothetical protein